MPNPEHPPFTSWEEANRLVIALRKEHPEAEVDFPPITTFSIGPGSLGSSKGKIWYAIELRWPNKSISIEEADAVAGQIMCNHPETLTRVFPQHLPASDDISPDEDERIVIVESATSIDDSDAW